MKTLEDFKKEEAKKYGYSDWKTFISSEKDFFRINMHHDLAAEKYAKYVQEETIKRCADCAMMKVHDGHFKTDSSSKYVQIGANNIQVDK